MEQQEVKMQKRINILVFVILLLLTSVVIAQTAREPQYNLEGKTNFTRVGVTGLNVSGNPGFIELVGFDSAGTAFPYYLWVDSTGDLRLASYPSISAYSSFPDGDWDVTNMAVGAVVGSQS